MLKIIPCSCQPVSSLSLIDWKLILSYFFLFLIYSYNLGSDWFIPLINDLNPLFRINSFDLGSALFLRKCSPLCINIGKDVHIKHVNIIQVFLEPLNHRIWKLGQITITLCFECQIKIKTPHTSNARICPRIMFQSMEI